MKDWASISTGVDPRQSAEFSDVQMSIRQGGSELTDVDLSTPMSIRDRGEPSGGQKDGNVDLCPSCDGMGCEGCGGSEFLEKSSVDLQELEALVALGVDPKDVEKHIRESMGLGQTRTVEPLSNERKAPYPTPEETLSDFDVDGQWIEDPREKQERWRRKYKLQQCKGTLDDGARCMVSVRGGDRCPEHPRKCQGTNRSGEPCKTNPLRNSEYCAAHISDEELQNGKRPFDVEGDGSGERRVIAVSQKFGTPEMAREAGKLGGQARRYPRLTETIQAAIEAHADRIVGAGIDALDATKPVVVEISGRDENGDRFTRQEVVEYPDHLVQLKAHEALTNRAFGRPHQAVDVNQETRQLSLALDARDPETRNMLHEFLRRRPSVDA